MNGHDVAEHTRLLAHRIYADAIDGRPGLIDDARAMLADGIAENGGTSGQRHRRSVPDPPTTACAPPSSRPASARRCR